jgi:hypothetical protein
VQYHHSEGAKSLIARGGVNFSQVAQHLIRDRQAIHMCGRRDTFCFWYTQDRSAIDVSASIDNRGSAIRSSSLIGTSLGGYEG